jgi:hypothetical protein
LTLPIAIGLNVKSPSDGSRDDNFDDRDEVEADSEDQAPTESDLVETWLEESTPTGDLPTASTLIWSAEAVSREVGHGAPARAIGYGGSSKNKVQSGCTASHTYLFTVQDECGNQASTNATLNLVDLNPLYFEQLPTDHTVEDDGR